MRHRGRIGISADQVLDHDDLGGVVQGLSARLAGFLGCGSFDDVHGIEQMKPLADGFVLGPWRHGEVFQVGRPHEA
jgi:hypothetical protein